MATRKLKFGFSTTDVTRPANITIWIDDVLMQDNVSVSNDPMNPVEMEYTFDAGTTFTFKVRLNNDYYNAPEDLNLCINYICLSNEDGTYTPYTYLLTDPAENNRKVDNSHLCSGMIWSAGGEFTLTVDTANPLIWYDHYQYNIDNP